MWKCYPSQWTQNLPISTETVCQLSYITTIAANAHIPIKHWFVINVQHAADLKDERENHGKTTRINSSTTILQPQLLTESLREKVELRKPTCENVIRVRNRTWEHPISRGALRYVGTIAWNGHIPCTDSLFFWGPQLPNRKRPQLLTGGAEFETRLAKTAAYANGTWCL